MKAAVGQLLMPTPHTRAGPTGRATSRFDSQGSLNEGRKGHEDDDSSVPSRQTGEEGSGRMPRAWREDRAAQTRASKLCVHSPAQASRQPHHASAALCVSPAPGWGDAEPWGDDLSCQRLRSPEAKTHTLLLDWTPRKTESTMRRLKQFCR